MKFLKGFTCFLLMLSYIALGLLFFAYYYHGVRLPHDVNFGGALILLLGASNVLHILYLMFTKCVYKRMQNEGFDKYIDEPMRKHCCHNK